MHIDIQPFAEYAVAPYVGAWIETSYARDLQNRIEVAPYVGAWIETLAKMSLNQMIARRTLRGCVD